MLRDSPVPGERELATFARRAWKLEEREYQYAACDVIAAYVGLSSERLLADLRFLVTHKSWWDTVDALAPSVGALVLAHPQLRTELDAWIGDDNIWLARVALLHQLRFKTHTDSGRLFRYCRQRATDDEFFLRKAIGWALREYSKTDAAAVRRFVAADADRLSPLSRREALLWLDRACARALTRLIRARLSTCSDTLRGWRCRRSCRTSRSGSRTGADGARTTSGAR